MYGYIYKTTCLVNNLIYIGQKKSPIFLEQKYLGSGKILKCAIAKYGRDNFKVELLQECMTFEELNYYEKFYIQKFNSVCPDIGYNISLGGQGTPGVDPGYHLGMQGKHQSDYQKKRASIANSRKRTEAEKANYRKGQLGKIIPSKRKKVQCVETGQVFNCLSDACKFAKSGHVGAVCKGKRNTAGGYH